MEAEFVWAIAYINRSFMFHIPKDLCDFGYKNVSSHIPTVKVLKKRFKGKNYYDEIPLLFNYGFFRIPIEGARDRDYLQRMKVAINGIYNWLYRPGAEIPVDNGEAPILVSTIRVKELAKLKRVSLLNSIYSSDDVGELSEGKYIVLRGYPFEGMAAEVISVHPKKETVKVKLLVDNSFNEVVVHFSNIFYSIYSGCDDPTPSDNTIEGLIDKSRVNKNKVYLDHGTEEA